MTAISDYVKYKLNMMNPDAKRAKLGDIIQGLQNAPTVGPGSITSTQLADNAVTTAKITDANVTSGKLAANAVLAGNAKIVTRDLVVAISGTSATATNAADISGVVLGAYFTAASADATATAITGVRFVPTTGALTVTVNAAATAATTIRVSILQAA